VAEASFGVKYDGPALKDGRMAVRDLAPALLSLGEVFTEASLLLYPEHDPVSLEIQATRDGSFVVNLILQGAGVAWDQFSAFAGSDAGATIAILKEYVVGGSADTSLFGLLKWLKGRRVVSQDPAVDPGRVKLTAEDGTTIDVPTEVAELHRNIRVRKKVREVVQPLERKGVRSLEFQSEKEVTFSLGDSDLPDFDLPLLKEAELADNEIEVHLEIVAPTFKEDNKWRFFDGDKFFHAPILDQEFLHRVSMGESFRKGDRLHCRLQMIQMEQPDGTLYTERRVVQVIKHIPSPTQLPLEDDDATAPLV
jgi:hypothetical protein